MTIGILRGLRPRVAASILAVALTAFLGLAGQPLSARAATPTGMSISETGGLIPSVNSGSITLALTTTTAIAQGSANATNDITVKIFAATKVSSDCSWSSSGCAGLRYTVAGVNLVAPRVNFITSNGDAFVQINTQSAIPAGTTVVITLDPGTVDLTNATGTVDFETLEAYNSVDYGSITFTPAVPFTATFDANGGSGSLSAQTAAAPTNLTANNSSITRSGYIFNGWNTASNGSGAAYADSASFPFSANATLYAQWTAVPAAAATPTLAVTGTDLAPGGIGAALLALGGLALALAIYRRRSNT